jgi:hypothetical protein
MSVGNQYGYLCPNCDKGTEILITANAEVLLTPTGTDIDSSTAPGWNNSSFVDCLNCGWAGTVGDLLQASIKKEAESERAGEERSRHKLIEPKIQA